MKVIFLPVISSASTVILQGDLLMSLFSASALLAMTCSGRDVDGFEGWSHAAMMAAIAATAIALLGMILSPKEQGGADTADDHENHPDDDHGRYGTEGHLDEQRDQRRKVHLEIGNDDPPRCRAGPRESAGWARPGQVGHLGAAFGAIFQRHVSLLI